MKLFIFVAILATVGVQAEEENPNQVLIRFKPINADDYQLIAGIADEEGSDESQRSDSRFINGAFSGLSSLAAGFKMGKYINSLFGSRETKAANNGYPLCTINADDAEGRQLDVSAYPNIEELIKSLSAQGDIRKGSPVINCVLVVDEKKPTTTTTKKPKPGHTTTTTPAPMYGPTYQPLPPTYQPLPPTYQPLPHPPTYPPHPPTYPPHPHHPPPPPPQSYPPWYPGGYPGGYPPYPYPPYGPPQYYPYMPYPPRSDDDEEDGEEDQNESPPSRRPHYPPHVPVPSQALHYLHLKPNAGGSTTRRPRPHSGARPPRRRRIQTEISHF